LDEKEMSQDFKIKKYKDATVYTLESASGGGTSSGSVASVSSPLGSVRKRGGNLIAQENDKKAETPKPRNFVAKNAKMGGAGAHKDKKKADKQGDVKHRKPFAEGWKDESSEHDEFLAHARQQLQNATPVDVAEGGMPSSVVKNKQRKPITSSALKLILIIFVVFDLIVFCCFLLFIACCWCYYD
jgi:hypothetical protein